MVINTIAITVIILYILIKVFREGAEDDKKD